MKPIATFLTSLYCLVLLAPADVSALPGEDTVIAPASVPLHGRINGLEAAKDVLFPAVEDDYGLVPFESGCVVLYESEGGHFSVTLRDIRANLFLRDSTVTTRFGDEGALHVYYDNDDLEFEMKLYAGFKTAATHPCSANDFYMTLSASAVSAYIRLPLEMGSRAPRIDEINLEAFELSGVNLTDSWLLDRYLSRIVSVVGFLSLGCWSVDTCATALAENVLEEQLTGGLVDGINSFLRELGGFSQTTSSDGLSFTLDVSPDSMTGDASNDTLTLTYATTISSDAPTAPCATLATLEGSDEMAFERTTGADFEVGIPFDFTARVLYNAVRQGILCTTFTAAGGAATVELTPQGALSLEATDEDSFKFTVPVHLDAVHATGTGDITADLVIYATVAVVDLEVALQVDLVDLRNYAGEVTVGGLTLSASFFSADIDAWVTDALPTAYPSFTLIPALTYQAMFDRCLQLDLAGTAVESNGMIVGVDITGWVDCPEERDGPSDIPTGPARPTDLDVPDLEPDDGDSGDEIPGDNPSDELPDVVEPT
jgi:hypothetical protein